MPSLLPPPPLADGRYQIGTPLGEGGMAVVWRGFDNALQIPCAVKILNQVFCRNEDLRARFLIEARTMARLRHPNIVSVQNLGEEDGCPYIVMEMLEGSVSALISASGPMPISLALEVTTQILRALELAHSQGVIHRDVKPANILFSSDRCFKLTDFGIARLRATDHSLTRTGVSLGTWGFMAPEQRKNSRHVDHRADLYAVGATLYALTVGSAPIDLFTADRDYTVLDDVSDILRPVIARATSYRPADRFADAAEMREALEAVRAQLEDEVLDYSFDLTPPPQLIPPAPDSDAEVAPDSDAEAAPDPPAPEEAPAAREEQEDDLPAAIFPDTTTGLDALLETPTPRRRQWLLTLAVAAAVMLLGVLTRPLWLSEPASEGIDLRDDAAAEDRATAAPPPEPEAPEPELTEPELTEPEVPAPELTEPELTEPEEAEPERPEPESRPAAPEPEPVAEAPEPTPVLKTGRITIRGDATSVRLKDDAGVLHSAGKLPPGSYVILAAFGDGEPFPAGTLALAEGQRLSVRCDSVFATCTVR